MKAFQYTIQDEQGIHARPAGLLVKEASGFASEITLEHEGKAGDAKRIFAVMALGIKHGDTLTVRVKGPDEETAATAMEAFLKANL